VPGIVRIAALIATIVSGACGDDVEPCPRGRTIVSLAAGPSLSSLVTDGSFLVWTDESSGSVFRVAASGGVPERVAQGEIEPHALIIDDANIYWMNRDGAIRVVGKTGGGVRDLLVGSGCKEPRCHSALAQDPEALFVRDAATSRVLRVDKATGTGVQVGASSMGGIAVTGGFVYWTDVVLTEPGGPVQLLVQRMSTAGGSADVFADLGDAFPGTVAAGTGHLVLAEAARDTGTTTLVAVPLTGGAAIEVSRGVGAATFAVDAYDVYYVTSGSLARRTLPDATISDIACDVDMVVAVTTSPSEIYWTDGNLITSVAK
jgi:hypothetical protein